MRTKTASQAEKILTVATRLFATHRFHEARMEDIALAAEVGKGTLYRYFKDKDELYEALLERAADQMLKRLRECTVGLDNPRAKLESIVAAFIDYFDNHPHLFDLIQHAEVMRRPDREFRWEQTRQVSLQLVQQVLEEGQQSGAFTVCDSHLAGLFLLGGLRAVMRFNKPPRSPDLPSRIVAMFLRGAVQLAPETCENSKGRRTNRSTPA